MLAWREWLAEDTGWQPARAGPVPVAWLGLTAAWPGTGVLWLTAPTAGTIRPGSRGMAVAMAGHVFPPWQAWL